MLLTWSFAASLLTWQPIQLLSYGAVLYWIWSDSMFTPNLSTIWRILTDATSGYGNSMDTTTCLNEEWTSSATSFSSFMAKMNYWQMERCKGDAILRCHGYFHSFPILMIFIFYFSILLIKEKFTFSQMRNICYFACK